jgi:hypothetical protein
VFQAWGENTRCLPCIENLINGLDSRNLNEVNIRFRELPKTCHLLKMTYLLRIELFLTIYERDNNQLHHFILNNGYNCRLTFHATSAYLLYGEWELKRKILNPSKDRYFGLLFEHDRIVEFWKADYDLSFVQHKERWCDNFMYICSDPLNDDSSELDSDIELENLDNCSLRDNSDDEDDE